MKGEKWPPTVAEIRELSLMVWEEQRRQSIRLLPKQGDEVEISPEQRAANLKLVREMVEKLAESKSVTA